jgi:hypothetical protein
VIPPHKRKIKRKKKEDINGKFSDISSSDEKKYIYHCSAFISTL